MNIRSDCPSADALRQIAANPSADGDLESVLSHLEGCEACTDTFRTVSAKNPFLETLRNAPQPQNDEPELVARLITMMQKLGPDGTISDRQIQAAELTAPLEHEASPAEQSSRYRFLAPPGGDELGRLGPYRVIRELGRGGMGIVFEAEDTALHRRVALKVMQPSQATDEVARQRFLAEARATAAIEHEHIVVIHQVGEAEGVPYLAMQLLRGESLAARLDRVPQLPITDAIRIALETARGLAAAHARKLIHRDIKPANIWLDAQGDRVKLVDFGLVRDLAGNSKLTLSGAISGTPAYMSPEQVEEQSLDARTDLFSLGCVMYRLLAGRLPFHGQTLVSILTAVTQSTPPAVDVLNPSVPHELGLLVNRLLAKDRDARPASADEVVAELQRIAEFYVNELPVVTSPTPIASNLDRGGRGWVIGLASAAAAAAFLLGLWVIVRNKDGNEIARIEVPEGGSVTTQTDNPLKTNSPVKVPTDTIAGGPVEKWPLNTHGSKSYFDAQRAFAEWAISVGAKLGLDNPGYGAISLEQLPKTPFRVQGVWLSGSAPTKVAESDLARLEDVPELLTLSLSDMPLSSAGRERIGRFVNLRDLELTNCGAVDDVFVDRVGNMAGLTSLAFADCGLIDKAMTERIGRLVKLNKLILDRCGLIDEALKPLAGLREMEVLFLQGNKQLTDEAFEHLQAMRKLKTLFITAGQGIRGRKVSFLQGCEALEKLNLQSNIDDEGLSEIAKLKHLSAVVVAGSYTDKGLESLGKLSNLNGFSINSKNITDSGLNKLIRKYRLTEAVNLANTPATDAVIDALTEQKALKQIDLPGGISASAYERLHAAVPGAQINWSGKLKAPTDTIAGGPVEKWPLNTRGSKAYFDAQRAFAEWAISLGGAIAIDAGSPKSFTPDSLPKTPFRVVGVMLGDGSGASVTGKISEADFANLENVPELTSFSLSDVPVSKVTTARIGQLLQLKHLSLGNCGLIDEAIEPLARLTEIVSLDLKKNSQLTDACFQYMTNMKKVKTLILQGASRITGVGLALLPASPEITFLNMNGSKITDAGMETVGTLVGLQTLHLATLNDGDVRSLGRLSDLREISFQGPMLSSRGYAGLKSFSKLESISMHGVTDEIVDVLANLKNLKTIKLFNPITASAVQRLRAQVSSECSIEWNGNKVPVASAKP